MLPCSGCVDRRKSVECIYPDSEGPSSDPASVRFQEPVRVVDHKRFPRTCVEFGRTLQLMSLHFAYDRVLATWPLITLGRCQTAVAYGLVLPNGFIDLQRLSTFRQPGGFTSPCGKSFDTVLEAARHYCPSEEYCKCNPPQSADISSQCVFDQYLGQACSTAAIRHNHQAAHHYSTSTTGSYGVHHLVHILEGHGVYCPCDLSFDCLFALALHASTTLNHWEIPIANECVSLARWTESIPSLAIGRVVCIRFHHRSYSEIAQCNTDFEPGAMYPYTSIGCPHPYIWVARHNSSSHAVNLDKSKDPRQTSVATLQRELSQLTGYRDDMLVLDFTARSAVLPAIVTPAYSKFIPELLEHVYDKQSFTHSLYVTSVLLDLLASYPLLRRHVASISDGFTSELHLLALFCAVAIPFFFHVRLADVEIQQAVADSAGMLSSTPVFAPHADVAVQQADHSLLFTFDSRPLARAIIRWFNGDATDLHLPLLLHLHGALPVGKG